MQETFDNILEKVSFEDKAKVTTMLNRCISISNDTSKSTYAIHDNVLFKIDVFFKELLKLINQVKKDKKIPLSVETLGIVLDELGVEITKEEAFIFYHLKDLGKFSLKDSKLKEQLKESWDLHKEFILDDVQMKDSLKALVGLGMINYRQGKITTRTSLIIRYKN